MFDEIDAFAADPQGFMSEDAQDRARAIMQMDRSGSLNKIAKSADVGFTDSDADMNLESLQAKYAGASRPLNEGTIPTNSRLPKEILQSFKENNIDITGSAALDEITRRSVEKRVAEKPMVVETRQVAQQQTAQQIDYSVIKAIVDESIRKYTSSLKKSILSESKEGSTNLRALKIGDKFSFIDESGNLYEAKLTFVKNLNEQKKRG